MTGETFGTSAGAFQGKIGRRRSTRLWQSHDFAAATVRSGISAACRRANSPTAKSRPAAQGRSSDPPPASCCAARYRKLGSTLSDSVVPAATSCGIGSSSSRGCVGIQRRVGQHAVGRAEIETDHVLGWHDSVLVRLLRVNSPLATGCRGLTARGVLSRTRTCRELLAPGYCDCSTPEHRLDTHFNSTSAGATIRAAAALPDHVGNSQVVASQPG